MLSEHVTSHRNGLAATAATLEVLGGLLVIPYLVLAAIADDPVGGPAGVINWISWSMLVVALILRRILAESTSQWFRHQWLWLVITIVSIPLTESGPLHALRLLRLASAMRLFGGVHRLTRILAGRAALGGLAIAATVTVIGGGLAFGAMEPKVKAGSWDGIWWALETATTVGYGDVVPTTTGARLVAVLVMVFGVGLVAAFTAALATAVLAAGKPGGDQDPLLTEIIERLERIEAGRIAQGAAGGRPGEPGARGAGPPHRPAEGEPGGLDV